MAIKLASAREQVSYILICPGCLFMGDAIWSEPVSGDTNEPRHVLVRLTTGFHVETGRTKPGATDIICDNCDHIQPD